MPHRIIGLLPDSDGLVVRTSDDEFASIADDHGPNFTMMSVQLLNILELKLLSERSGQFPQNTIYNARCLPYRRPST